MRFCFLTIACWTLTLPGICETAPQAPGKITSVVRTDPRSGRLVRSIVVQRRPAASVSPADIDLGRLIDEAAREQDVDPLLVHSVIEVESSYDPFAVSPKGAEGLMQLIPRTAHRFGVRNSFNLKENVAGGVRYLKHLLDLFGDERLAVAAYNAGEQAVLRYGGVPPYPETRNYVRLVTQKYGQARQALALVQPARESSEQYHPPVEQFIDDLGRIHIRTR